MCISRFSGLIKLEDLAGLSGEQLLDIAYDMLRYCNHTV